MFSFVSKPFLDRLSSKKGLFAKLSANINVEVIKSLLRFDNCILVCSRPLYDTLFVPAPDRYDYNSNDETSLTSSHMTGTFYAFEQYASIVMNMVVHVTGDSMASFTHNLDQEF